MVEGEDRARAASVVWAVLLTAAVTSAVIFWGPEPAPPTALFEPIHGLHEPRDRAWYIGWLVLPPVLAWGLWRLVRPAGALPLGVALLGGSVLALLGATVDDAWLYGWHGYGIGAMAFGLLAAWCAERLWGHAVFRFGVAILAAGWGAAGAGMLWQTPLHVFDPYHFSFLSDDLLAFLADPVPLRGFSPTYTALLGAPLVLPVRLFGWEPLAAVCAWLWSLSLLTLGLLLAALSRVGGLRWFWLYALVVVTVPMLVDGTERATGLSLWHTQPVWPTRVVVPAATFCAFAWWRAGRERRLAGPTVVGGLAALGVLCNADMGLVNLLTAGAAVSLLSWRDGRWSPPTAFLAAVGAVFSTYAAVYVLVLGGMPDVTGLLTFIRMFGLAGYGNVAMPPLGLNTVAAAFATLCLWLAVTTREADARVEALGYAAALALGAMAYYVGRSHTINLATGAGLWLGVCGALWVTLRAERPAWPCQPLAGWEATVLAAAARLPLATILAGLVCQPLPTRVLPTTPYPDKVAPPAGVALPAGTGTFSRNGHLWALRRGVPSTLTVDHPFQLGGPALGECYCQDLERQRRAALWVEPGSGIWRQLVHLSRLPACWRAGLTPEALAHVPWSVRRSEWVLLPLRPVPARGVEALTSPSSPPP